MEIINGVSLTDDSLSCGPNKVDVCMLGCQGYCACLTDCFDFDICPQYVFCLLELDLCVVHCFCAVNA